MWQIAVSAPLLSIIIVMFSRHYGDNVSTLSHRALAWVLRSVRGSVCVRSTHAFVFSNCTHGKVDSVLETFDLYANTHPSVAIGTETGEVLDEVVRRIRPTRVLELGMHCGYSSVRMLRLLPPGGRLIAVELDPLTAEFGEEIIMVAGFKHSQFQVLTSSSAEAIPSLRSLLKPAQKTSAGFSLVLMDHDAQQFLPDLLALEKEELLCSSGCSVLLINRKRRAEDLREILSHVRVRSDCYCIKSQRPCIVEVFYRKKMAEV